MVVDVVVCYDVLSDRQRDVLSLIVDITCYFTPLAMAWVCLTDVALDSVSPYAAKFGCFGYLICFVLFCFLCCWLIERIDIHGGLSVSGYTWFYCVLG
jgi:hypothetical protein